MPPLKHATDQILSVAQMQAAEAALVKNGVSVDTLMQRAGLGAAEYIWRLAMQRAVTVLAGPGNNGGDAYVIAEALRLRGVPVCLVAADAPSTDAARQAASLYRGPIVPPGDVMPQGEVLVDALFGSGLSRALNDRHRDTLLRLAASHPLRIALDVPSGIDASTGTALNEGLPDYRLTLALGAWKRAHVLMPALAKMGDMRLVDIGIAPMAGAGQILRRPQAIKPPQMDAHKYTRGMLGVVAGAMPGAAMLAARSAMGAGAGYVQLMTERPLGTRCDLVSGSDHLLDEERLAVMLVGPGLGRDERAESRLLRLLSRAHERSLPLVLDADALALLKPGMLVGRGGIMPEHPGPAIATPHEGEMKRLEAAFSIMPASGTPAASKINRTLALASVSGMVIVAKGPDTIIAAPDGRWLAAPRATSWLSVAGSGDVLAGCIASRFSTGQDAFAAAAQGVWLHSEAARLAGAGFSASDLAVKISSALVPCL